MNTSTKKIIGLSILVIVVAVALYSFMRKAPAAALNAETVKINSNAQNSYGE